MAADLNAATRGVSGARATKRGAKLIADLVAVIVASPLAGLYWLLASLAPTRRETTFQAFGQFVSLWPGLPGDFLRRAFYRLTLAECAADCSIQFGTLIVVPDVHVGHGVYIGVYGNIAHCRIGDDTLLGSNVTVLSGNRQHHIDRVDIPIRHQGGTHRTVSIGRDVWIGNGAIILHDVGDHAVVAAGAVVTKPVEPWAIVGGNPARVLGHRDGAATPQPMTSGTDTS